MSEQSTEEFTFDFSTVDCSQSVVDLDAIRKVNPHRFEMEMLSGIVLMDPGAKLAVGYKDLTDKDFWVRGHMPGYPLLPGVMMLEAAAQLASYFASTSGIVPTEKIIALGGIDDARFVRQAKPGDRLVIVSKGLKLSRRLFRSRCIGAVNNEKVFEATITGVVLPDLKEKSGA
jgi:3-hydroxyacyl-[acyl-carrier-protein] dehydratase